MQAPTNNQKYFSLYLIVLICISCTSEEKIEIPPVMTIDQKILAVAKPWMGTPYKWGGEDREGIDCSAFTRLIYDEVFSLKLPRTVQEQKKEGSKVNNKLEFQPGDLLIFKTGGLLSKKEHAGIYLTNDQFIHASVSQGVVISDLENKYWRKKLRQARRLSLINI